MTVEALLEKLADGEFHSGEELGQWLQVSRTAVWKQLQKLEQLGLPLESVKGRGYRLCGGIDLLSAAAVEAALSETARARISKLDIRSVVDSTNTVVSQAAASGATAGYACAAEQQSAGRGRRGRPWVSPYAQNLYFSLLWEFEGGAAALEGLSLAVGVAVARVLARQGLASVRLKWPNDVLADGGKLAGILLEMHGDAAGRCQVVVGVGLNVTMRTGEGIDQPWTDLASLLPQPPSRSELLGLLLSELVEVLACFTRDGFAAFREEWQALDAFRDSEVTVRLGDNVVPGIARGVDVNGGLLLETATGRQVFNGGEVSLRRTL